MVVVVVVVVVVVWLITFRRHHLPLPLPLLRAVQSEALIIVQDQVHFHPVAAAIVIMMVVVVAVVVVVVVVECPHLPCPFLSVMGVCRSLHAMEEEDHIHMMIY